ncbi:MAG TPA: YbaN family protein [Eoetvoesiella sp.]|jgi:uncharacterized membrane protein YbaN (DUF454 family)|uniref:YbaN family protein n=1 Tax=Eoetvoesiella sp. TaxID=1966355 RepID=UPI002B66DF6D|nr:YbaN family protein [Eoetvoesiella sp.]HWK62250.1 YbaN family protein [Eoetvoesiella sp.]
MKAFFIIVGTLAVALAIAGVFLPLLPTTPFLLLASACYMRGSTRLHRWLTSNRLLGPYIAAIENRSGMPRPAKVVALLLMWASLSYSIYIVPPAWAKAGLAAMGAAISLYIVFGIPTMKPRTDKGAPDR